MFSPLTKLIATRYFSSKRQNSRFLSFIRLMAIGGIMVGSAGLLMALSIAHGFKSVINQKIMSFGPEIVIQTFSDYPILKTDTLLTFLRKDSEIAFAQPVVESEVMIQVGERVEGILIRGLESTDEVTEIGKYLVNKTYFDQKEGVILGKKLSNNLEASIGKVAFLYHLNGTPSRSNPPDIQKTEITDIFDVGIDKFEESLALAPIDWTRKFLNYSENQSDKVFIKVKPGINIRKYSAELNERLPYPLHTETVFITFESIFAWVNLQEQTIPLVIAVMIIVAAFNLIGTILMMVLERTRDIGILKAMGANDSSIRSIFLIQGTLIATSGLILGLAVSFLFFWLQTSYSILPLPQENYYMTTVPVELHIFDILLVCVITFVLSLLASYLPARVAAQIQPLKIISFGKG